MCGAPLVATVVTRPGSKLDTPGQVQSVRPDLERIRRLPVSRVLVTAAGGDGYAQM